MTLTDLLIIAAATWYTSYVLTSSDGPFQVFSRLRNWREGRWHGRKTIVIKTKVDLGGYGGTPAIAEAKEYKDVSGLLDCPVCLSIWVAIVFVLAPVGWLTYAFATAGIAMWVHSYSGWRASY